MLDKTNWALVGYIVLISAALLIYTHYASSVGVLKRPVDRIMEFFWPKHPWVEHTSINGNFKAQFPEPPSYSFLPKMKNKPEAHIYRAKDHLGTIYEVRVYIDTDFLPETYPGDLAESGVVSFFRSETGFNIQGRALSSGSTVYELRVRSPEKVQIDGAKFFQYFQILDSN